MIRNRVRLEAMRARKFIPTSIDTAIKKQGEKGKEYTFSRNGNKYISLTNLGYHISAIIRAVNGGMEDDKELGLEVGKKSLSLSSDGVQAYCAGCEAIEKMEERTQY